METSEETSPIISKKKTVKGIEKMGIYMLKNMQFTKDMLLSCVIGKTMHP